MVLPMHFKGLLIRILLGDLNLYLIVNHIEFKLNAALQI